MSVGWQVQAGPLSNSRRPIDDDDDKTYPFIAHRSLQKQHRVPSESHNEYRDGYGDHKRCECRQSRAELRRAG